MSQSKEDLMRQKDIGDVIAENIYNYFKENKNLIDSLISLGVNMKYLGPKVIHNDLIDGKKFVITGTISGVPRDKIKEFITLNGGDVIESVSKKTDIIIVGENPGSKYDKAVNLNIPIWNEEKIKEIMDLKY